MGPMPMAARQSDGRVRQRTKGIGYIQEGKTDVGLLAPSQFFFGAQIVLHHSIKRSETLLERGKNVIFGAPILQPGRQTLHKKFICSVAEGDWSPITGAVSISIFGNKIVVDSFQDEGMHLRWMQQLKTLVRRSAPGDLQIFNGVCDAIRPWCSIFSGPERRGDFRDREEVAEYFITVLMIRREKLMI
ncbi:hypothetical protein CDAR_27051 [Caerostris darwini]|uniref:Uncharacterized protein n=1 Tax=Caerostris darwini TaxID=1538125 RepID=A0AAV4TC68_9ARAC|nr:hypothetical protein CDAR_27051 [Caerostris darwini]